MKMEVVMTFSNLGVMIMSKFSEYWASVNEKGIIVSVNYGNPAHKLNEHQIQLSYPEYVMLSNVRVSGQGANVINKAKELIASIEQKVNELKDAEG